MAKWIQCEDKESKEYKSSFFSDWSSWQPYLQLGDTRRSFKNGASLYRQKWITDHGWDVIPSQFGIYALGVLPPDTSFGKSDEIKPADRWSLEQHVLIVNHGIVGGAAAESNTLNKRLMTYSTKVKAYEYALVAWMTLGFRVFVKWKVIYTSSEKEKRMSSKEGAALRKGAETVALSLWKFALNVSEQKGVRGAGVSSGSDPLDFVVKETKTGNVTARSYKPQVDVKKQQQSPKPAAVRCSIYDSDDEILEAGRIGGLKFMLWLGLLSDGGSLPLEAPVRILKVVYDHRKKIAVLDRLGVYEMARSLLETEKKLLPQTATAAAVASATTASAPTK